MVNAQSAAFFDFDGTLIRGDSQALELRYIIDNERPPLHYFIKLIGPALIGGLVKLGLASHKTYNRAYVRTYKGQCRQTLKERGKRLFKDKLFYAFFSQVMDLISEHRRNGRKIVLVSASPFHILEPVADHLKPDALICTVLEFGSDEKCTGYPLGRICMGSAKAEHIREFAIQNKIQLDDCYAYTDHHADLDFLEAAGCPEVVNPTTILLDIARERKWPVHRYA